MAAAAMGGTELVGAAGAGNGERNPGGCVGGAAAGTAAAAAPGWSCAPAPRAAEAREGEGGGGTDGDGLLGVMGRRGWGAGGCSAARVAAWGPSSIMRTTALAWWPDSLALGCRDKQGEDFAASVPEDKCGT